MSSDNSSERETSDDSDDSIQIKSKFEKSLIDVSHRDSFHMLDINYYECMKATSLWFKDIEKEIELLAASTSEDEDHLLLWRPVFGSLNDS